MAAEAGGGGREQQMQSGSKQLCGQRSGRSPAIGPAQHAVHRLMDCTVPTHHHKTVVPHRINRRRQISGVASVLSLYRTTSPPPFS